MGDLPIGEVTGAKEAMRALRQIEPTLARQAVQDIKSAAEPARSAIASAAPAQVLSRVPAGRVRVTTNYGGRARASGETTLVRIRLVGPRWTAAGEFAMVDHAGHTFARNLRAKYGGAPRFAWPVVDRMGSEWQAAVTAAVNDVERTVNAMIGRG